MNVDLDINCFANKSLNNKGIKRILNGYESNTIDKIISEINLVAENLKELPSFVLNKTKFNIAGGSIRDILCGKEPKDLDFICNIPTNIRINKNDLMDFSSMPQEVKDKIIDDFRKYLAEKSYIYKRQPITEDELSKFLILNESESVYSTNVDGSWNLDKMFNNSDKDNELRKLYGDDTFNGIGPALKKVNVLEAGSNFISLVLANSLEYLYQKKGHVQCFGSSTEEFVLTQRELGVEERWEKTVGSKPRSESSLDDQIMNLLEIENYRILKGIRNVIKTSCVGGSIDKDFIITYVEPQSFVRTFDFNVLEMFIPLNDFPNSLQFKDSKDLLSSIVFNENSETAYSQKILNMNFTNGENFKERLPRFESRLNKAFDLFENFEFSATIGKLSVSCEDNNKFKTYSKEELSSEGVNIDDYSLLVAFTLSMIIKEKNKHVKVETVDEPEYVKNSYKI